MVHVSIMSQNSVCVFYRIFLLVLLKRGGKGEPVCLAKSKCSQLKQCKTQPDLRINVNCCKLAALSHLVKESLLFSILAVVLSYFCCFK